MVNTTNLTVKDKNIEINAGGINPGIDCGLNICAGTDTGNLVHD